MKATESYLQISCGTQRMPKQDTEWQLRLPALQTELHQQSSPCQPRLVPERVKPLEQKQQNNKNTDKGILIRRCLLASELDTGLDGLRQTQCQDFRHLTTMGYQRIWLRPIRFWGISPIDKKNKICSLSEAKPNQHCCTNWNSVKKIRSKQVRN